MDSVNPRNVMLRKSGAGTDQYYVRLINPPMHPGATNTPMPQFYALPDQRRLVRVPRPPHLSPHQESIPGITFSTRGCPGVLAKDILMDKVTVDAPHDAVLEPHGFRSIVASLEWPGYEPGGSNDPMRSRIDVRPGGTSITRQNLAREICGLLFSFHKVASKSHVAPEWEHWALTSGKDGVRLCDVVLFSLHYYRNVWVPEFYVIE